MTKDEIAKRYKNVAKDYIDPDPDAYGFDFMVREIRTLLSRIRTLEEGIKEFLKYSEHTNILSPLRTKLQKLLEEKGETENAM